ncbi:hypothetical protein P153DRAFT_26579 [Dothidotthia symphoricarpi CBS 119687]|uniref:Uncharacterized protein n=1 Tax=Dothidotthia symphoricarpi CBS 119687 TaxID=1392245 RepID=A0A6A6AC67_9PLEO|nr:uncharacterized protein P153DRAFT_26579 [Dothidotthia symphoricarpi CBS 119687]KAF2128833.1 hypothetical protein P153DRAFT_26579 [Dothidotthia symphoricarpi CBS 119687]
MSTTFVNRVVRFNIPSNSMRIHLTEAHRGSQYDHCSKIPYVKCIVLAAHVSWTSCLHTKPYSISRSFFLLLNKSLLYYLISTLIISIQAIPFTHSLLPVVDMGIQLECNDLDHFSACLYSRHISTFRTLCQASLTNGCFARRKDA